MTTTIHMGDCRDVLPTLPERSVQMVVTSPPYYALRSYLRADDPNKAREIGAEPAPDCLAWARQEPPCGRCYVCTMRAVFGAAWRVLRDDGVLWLNLGDSYASGGMSNPSGKSTLGGGKDRGAADYSLSRRAPDGFQSKDLLGIPWRVALALQADGWVLRSDVVWAKPNCLSGGAIVYARTQKGDMPMMVKDLVRLRPETVQLWNGERWTQVVRWIENPRPDAPLELVLRNGQRVGCTPDHLWPTQRGNVRADELQVGDTIQMCRLPEPDAPAAPAHLPDDIGWFVGLYIAEGSRGGNDAIQFASHTREVERFERLRAVAEAYGGTCRKHQTDANGMTINLHGKVLNAIVDTYVSGSDAGDKHLAPPCWRRSNDFLRAVLEGYLSGDGHYDQKNNRWRLGFTRNYNLEAGLRGVCARLGYSLRLALSTANIGEQEYPAFRGELRLHARAEDGEIVKVGRSKARKFWDITVADDPHLFALASGVLTHNCMPESVQDRPTKAHEYLFLLAKQPRYFYDADAISERSTQHGQGALGELRTKKPAETTNGRGATTLKDAERTTRNARTVWTIPTAPYSGAHFAVFPEALAERCVRAGSAAQACPTCGAAWVRVVERESEARTFPGVGLGVDERKQNGRGGSAGYVAARSLGFSPACACAGNDGSARSVVLDPFGGSGTTGRVAERLGRDAVLIELNADYAALHDERLNGVQREMAL